MTPDYVRPIAICVFRRDGGLFVFEGYDSAKGDHFYRPLGGAVEFGEPSDVTVRREILEEIGAEVTDLRHLGTMENIFTLEGQPGHEIVMVYEAKFADRSFYDRSRVDGHEDDGSPFKALWMPMDDFQQGRARLVPEGLLELLTRLE